MVGMKRVTLYVIDVYNLLSESAKENLCSCYRFQAESRPATAGPAGPVPLALGHFHNSSSKSLDWMSSCTGVESSS